MPKIKINKQRCKGCLLCIDVCFKHAIKKSSKLNKRGTSFAEFDHGKGCIGCTMCALICPDCCIEVWK